MPKTTLVHITYVGPYDEVVVAATGLTAKRGETVEVADQIAGRAPKGDDPGEGLLAQPTNWQPAKTTAADATPSSEPQE
jgi:hypothetical protein